MLYECALDGLRSGFRFFGVVPRVRPENTKKDCVPYFDVVWVDIDREEGVDPYPLLAEIKSILPSDFLPSAVVFSGNKGLHCYWKLDGMLPIGEVERWNKVLAEVLGGDRNCHDATRILAHPGLPHRKTGKLVEIIEFSAEIHPAERLDLLPLPEAKAPSRKQKSRDRALQGEDGEWFEAADALTCWGDPTDLDLGNWLLQRDRDYMASYKPKGWRLDGMSRSEMEMHIVHILVGKGASDDQVIDLADGFFSKHHDESSYRYIELTIRKAREHWYRNGWLTHPDGGGRKPRDAAYRWTSTAEYQVYVEMIHGQKLSEWVREVEGHGRSRATAYRHANDLAKAGIVVIRGERIYRVGVEAPKVQD